MDEVRKEELKMVYLLAPRVRSFLIPLGQATPYEPATKLAFRRARKVR